MLQRADQNGDGLLTADEYYSILVDHGVECSREEIREIIRTADQDHDGCEISCSTRKIEV